MKYFVWLKNNLLLETSKKVFKLFLPVSKVMTFSNSTIAIVKEDKLYKK